MAWADLQARPFLPFPAFVILLRSQFERGWLLELLLAVERSLSRESGWWHVKATICGARIVSYLEAERRALDVRRGMVTPGDDQLTYLDQLWAEIAPAHAIRSK